MAETEAEEVRRLVATLEALACRPLRPDGGDREELAGRLLAAMRAGADALGRLSREAGRDGSPPLEERARAAVEGGVAGLVAGLDRGLPRLEDELRRLGPSLQDVAVRLGTGLVAGVTAELGRRGPELAKAAGRLVGELVRELGRQAREAGRGIVGPRFPRLPRRRALAAGTGALLAAGAAVALLRRGR